MDKGAEHEKVDETNRRRVDDRLVNDRQREYGVGICPNPTSGRRDACSMDFYGI